MREIEIKDKNGKLLYIGADTRQGACVDIPKTRIKNSWKTKGIKYLKINNRKCRTLWYFNSKATHLTIWVTDEPTIIRIGAPEKAAEKRFFDFCKSGDVGQLLKSYTEYYHYNTYRHHPFTQHLIRKLKQIKIDRDCDNCPDKFRCWTRK